MVKIIQYALIGVLGVGAVVGGWLFYQHRVSATAAPPQQPSLTAPAKDDILQKLQDSLQEIKAQLQALKAPPQQPKAPAVADDPFRDFAKAYTAAAAANKPLVIWSCYYCGSSAAQLPGMVHVRADRFNGDPTPRVIVGVPDGRGGFVALNESIPAPAVCANSINAALSPPPTPSQANPWPAAAPHPQMTAMGGGGFSGGG